MQSHILEHKQRNEAQGEISIICLNTFHVFLHIITRIRRIFSSLNDLRLYYRYVYPVYEEKMELLGVLQFPIVLDQALHTASGVSKIT